MWWWLSHSTSCPLIPFGTARELTFQAHLHAHWAVIFILHIHSNTFKANSAAEHKYEHAALAKKKKERKKRADIRCLSEWCEDSFLGESQRSVCQSHLSSRLGTKEVGASVPLPPSCASLLLHNKVLCCVGEESCTPRAGESSVRLKPI